MRGAVCGSVDVHAWRNYSNFTFVVPIEERYLKKDFKG
ncbi:hypothetical protein B4133_0539 [Bacillus altitudinis]|nr:hypothetical protein B4133_0539 [Bacillus altitudinis]